MTEFFETGLITIKGVPIPLAGVTLDGDLVGQALACRLQETFVNNEQTALEVVYKFPLSDTAAVRGFRIRLGEREIKGKIEEQEEAFKLYSKALKKGHFAGLLDEERPNIFTLSVGNLPPGETAVITIEWVEICPVLHNRTRITFPMTIAPRYVPEDNSDEDERVNPPLHPSPGYGLKLALRVHGRKDITSIASPTHPIRTDFTEDTATVELCCEVAAMDRDFVLEVERPAERIARAWCDDAGFAGLDICLPENWFGEIKMPLRKLVFLLDCSGSMCGDSITEARLAMQILLAALEPEMHFAIYRFGSDFERYGEGFLPAGTDNLNKARMWLSRVDADLGGTELLAPLRSIVHEADRNTDIILLTDGEVSNEAAVINQMAGTGIRVFTIGIGHGPNSFLLNELARRTGGSFRPVVPGERIEAAMLEVFGQLTAPACSISSLEWGTETILATPLRALFPEEHVLLLGRLENADWPEEATIEICVGEETRSLHIPIGKVAGNTLPLATLWGRERIRQLETGIGQGSLQKRSKNSSSDDELIVTSKEFNILSTATSFVGIEDEPNKGNKGPLTLRIVPVMPVLGLNPFSGFSDPNMICCCLTSPRDVLYSACEKDASLLTGQTISDPRQDEVLTILACLKPEGHFALTDAVYADILHMPRIAVPGRITLPETEANQIIETTLTLNILSENYADLAKLWKKVAKKAETWLAQQGDPMVEGIPVREWIRGKMVAAVAN